MPWQPEIPIPGYDLAPSVSFLNILQIRKEKYIVIFKSTHNFLSEKKKQKWGEGGSFE